MRKICEINHKANTKLPFVGSNLVLFSLYSYWLSSNIGFMYWIRFSLVYFFLKCVPMICLHDVSRHWSYLLNLLVTPLMIKVRNTAKLTIFLLRYLWPPLSVFLNKCCFRFLIKRKSNQSKFLFNMQSCIWSGRA